MEVSMSGPKYIQKSKFFIRFEQEQDKLENQNF